MERELSDLFDLNIPDEDDIWCQEDIQEINHPSVIESFINSLNFPACLLY
jgi:hypothetical protein